MTVQRKMTVKEERLSVAVFRYSERHDTHKTFYKGFA